MSVFIFRWSGLSNLIGVAPTPDMTVLPRPETSHEWRFFHQIEENELGKAHLPWEQVKEQISRYGYCLLQSEIGNENTGDW
jgi:hypothetical protein